MFDLVVRQLKELPHLGHIPDQGESLDKCRQREKKGIEKKEIWYFGM